MSQASTAQLLRELAVDGLLVADTLDGEVAFRTLIQVDGDVCCSIRRDALTAANFRAAHDAHLEHVEREVGEIIGRFERWATRKGRLIGILVGLASTGVSGLWLLDGRSLDALSLLELAEAAGLGLGVGAGVGVVLTGAARRVIKHLTRKLTRKLARALFENRGEIMEHTEALLDRDQSGQ